ncbi:15556_t:CDS:2 [Cetraspora pellucida]|uniref:15556_t:CDS:1 n=1 Tax=Cetraspora pellucida TaxID=1433469 RepID=A0A9N9NSE0_9GLOM|nr:15556_t:CDS:2 [Cetraspora pellucida]
MDVCQYGKCFECGGTNSGSNFCSKCEIDFLRRNFSKWTSGNVNIDSIIQKTQTTAFVCVDYLEWIPFENFDFVKYHARGAFSVIYSSVWLEGPRHIFDNESQDWVRSGPIKCALKRIENSQSICQEYLDNILKYHECFRNASAVVDCFGLTRDPTGCYMLVTRFYESGNLHQYLAKTMGCLCWRDVIDMLWGIIVSGLEPIHENELFHGNLHGGNLLVEEHPELINVKLSDIGLYGPADISELAEILTSWITAISDDPDPSPTSEQFDIAEEKRFSDLINKTFSKPKFHNQAVYFSRLLDYRSLCKNTQ